MSHYGATRDSKRASNMIEEIRLLTNQYWDLLKDKTALRTLNGWVEVTTPFLDRHNDYIQIYVRKHGEAITITDDGETIQDLRSYGCDLDTPKRSALLNTTLRGFGIGLEADQLTVHASSTTFGIKKHNLIQAMLAVNDLFYLSTPSVRSLFLEDVEEWLTNNEIRFTPRVKLAGQSGYDHMFDFVIPSSRSAPERLLRAINKPNRDRAQQFAFAWHDTREVRPADSKAIAVLNNTDQSVPEEVFEALRAYDISTVLWTNRDEARELVAA